MSDKTEGTKAPSLSEFVSAAILDIAAGLNDAQDKGGEIGVKILPNAYEDSYSESMDIEFDLSITSIAQTKTGTGLKIGVFSFGGEHGREGAESVESSNRLRFTVPVNYVVLNRGRVKNPHGNDWNPIAGKL